MKTLLKFYNQQKNELYGYHVIINDGMVSIMYFSFYRQTLIGVTSLQINLFFYL